MCRAVHSVGISGDAAEGVTVDAAVAVGTESSGGRCVRNTALRDAVVQPQALQHDVSTAMPHRSLGVPCIHGSVHGGNNTVPTVSGSTRFTGLAMHTRGSRHCMGDPPSAESSAAIATSAAAALVMCSSHCQIPASPSCAIVVVAAAAAAAAVVDCSVWHGHWGDGQHNDALAAARDATASTCRATPHCAGEKARCNRTDCGKCESE